MAGRSEECEKLGWWIFGGVDAGNIRQGEEVSLLDFPPELFRPFNKDTV